MGVQNYFARIIDACLQAWPALADNGLLVAHAGHVEDPLLIEWSAPMVKPAMPGYSFYFGPGDFAPGKPSPVGQPGLRDALAAYHNVNQTKKKADMRYVVIPARPAGTEGWSADTLAALVTRDSMIGTGLPKAADAA